MVTQFQVTLNLKRGMPIHSDTLQEYWIHVSNLEDWLFTIVISQQKWLAHFLGRRTENCNQKKILLNPESYVISNIIGQIKFPRLPF